MKLIFNDATHIEIESANHRGNELVFKVTRAEGIAEYFEDEDKTRRMVVKRDDEVLYTFEGFSSFYGITECTDGTFDVIMYKSGQTPEERIKFLEEDVEAHSVAIESNSTNVETAFEAIAELTEIVVG